MWWSFAISCTCSIGLSDTLLYCVAILSLLLSFSLPPYPPPAYCLQICLVSLSLWELLYSYECDDHYHLPVQSVCLIFCYTVLLFFVFFCFAFPSYISGVHHFWVRFLRMWPFFNPTIKVVTFRLCGWCVLGVFFVAGIHPSRTWTSGSFESVRWNACVHRLDLGLYSHPKEFLGEWSLNPC